MFNNMSLSCEKKYRRSYTVSYIDIDNIKRLNAWRMIKR